MSRYLVTPMRRKGKSGWWGDYTLSSGRRIRAKLGETRHVAEMRAREMTKALANGTPLHVRGDRILTFRGFVESEYKPNKKVSMRSWEREKGRVESLVDHFGDLPLAAVDLPAIGKFIQKRRADGVKNATVNRQLARLKNIFSMAENNKILPTNPMRKYPIGGSKGLAEEPRIRFLDRTEYDLLVAHLPHPVKRLVIVAAHTGMRKEELLGLTWPDVKYENHRIMIRMDKDGDARPVPMDATVEDVFRNSLLKLREGKVFLWDDGSPIKDFRGSFDRARKEAGIKNLRFHDLRHTYITWALDAGVPMTTVARIVGHKTLVMTRRYAHVVDSMMDEAARRVDGYAKEEMKRAVAQ